MSSVLSVPAALSKLWPYLKSDKQLEINEQGIPEYQVSFDSEGMRANVAFLEHPDWCQYYFDTHHRAETFRSR